MLPQACQGANRKKAIIVSSLACSVMLLIFISIIAVLSWLQGSGELKNFYIWVSSIGVAGNVILCVILAVSNFPFMMGYVLIVMLTGLLFGFWLGLLTVIVGSFLGWFPCFLLLRYSLYDKSVKYIEEKGGYVARGMMKELASHQKTVSILIRIGPVPPGLQTAMLAVSPINTAHYVWTSFLGMLIKQVPLTFIGSSVKKVLDLALQDGDDPTEVPSKAHNAKNITLLTLGAIGTALLFVFGFYISKRAMDTAKKIKEEEERLLEEGTPMADFDVETESESLPEHLVNKLADLDEDDGIRMENENTSFDNQNVDEDNIDPTATTVTSSFDTHASANSSQLTTSSSYLLKEDSSEELDGDIYENVTTAVGDDAGDYSVDEDIAL